MERDRTGTGGETDAGSNGLAVVGHVRAGRPGGGLDGYRIRRWVAIALLALGLAGLAV